MSKRTDSARRLYLDGIRDGRYREAVAANTGARYTQHSTGVRDGQEGFIEFFEGFIARNPKREIELLRVFEDGPFVFVHAYQSLNDGAARWVTTDLFDTDDQGLLIEHWDVIGPVVDVTRSGRSQIDGPRDVQDLPNTDANKAVVRALVEGAFVAGDDAPLSSFISSARLDQHDPAIGDGLDAFSAYLDDLASQGRPLTYRALHRLVGQGNFVATLCECELAGQPMAVFDLWRLEHGLIVEHWDNVEPVPPPEQLVNRGKF